eukprot:767500-Pelagomonas_calceolata.AAC.1
MEVIWVQPIGQLPQKMKGKKVATTGCRINSSLCRLPLELARGAGGACVGAGGRFGAEVVPEVA